MKTNQFRQHLEVYQCKKSFKSSKSQRRIWNCLTSKQIEHRMSSKSASKSSSMSHTANRPFRKSKFIIRLYSPYHMGHILYMAYIYGPWYTSPYYMDHIIWSIQPESLLTIGYCMESPSSDNLSRSAGCVKIV